MEYFLDVEKMSAHVDDILEEKRTAQKLYDTIQAVKRLTFSKYDVDPSLALKFQHLIDKADNMVEFCSKLADATDNISIDGLRTVREIAVMLEDNKNLAETVRKSNIDIDVDKV